MRKLLSALLLCLLATACVTQSALPPLTAELSDPATSNRRCLSIVRRLRHADIHQTGGALIDLLASERFQFPYYSTPGVMPDPMPIEMRLEIAARDIFETYLAGPDPEAEKAVFLCRLLQARHDTDGRVLLLYMIPGGSWSPAVETPIAAIATAPAASPKLRRTALALLMQHCDSNRYFVATSEMIRNLPLTKGPVFLDTINTWSTREEYFREIVGTASRLSPENRNALLRLGFAILRETQTPNPGTGRFLATDLGRALGIKGEFEPDQSSPKYQGNDLFAEDTVRNALAWADAHGF